VPQDRREAQQKNAVFKLLTINSSLAPLLAKLIGQNLLVLEKRLSWE
jgi:hypothetical protein